jgi:lysophospholipase L1-like esterase
MISTDFVRLFFICCLFSTFLNPAGAMISSPRISRDKSVATSGGDAGMVVDGSFSGWSAWTVTNNSWIAIDIGTGPSQIFFVWNNPAYTWSDVIADPHRSDCQQTLSYPVDYTISVSSNSTDGSDGEWTIKETVSDNNVSVRGHLIDFADARWVRMNIASGGGKLDEIEVFDASGGFEDGWFFAGTSISANAYKSSIIEDNFPTLINRNHTSFHPAMLRGGIPCISSGDFARDISMYLEAAGNCRYWAIEMGTNDAWGGSDGNAATFKSNLQKVIDSCRAHDVEPIIARVLGTNSDWQPHAEFLEAVDALTEDNDLIEGPDFYQAALDDPVMLGNDGVHPSDHGAEVMHKLWAKKMDYLYTTVAVEKKNIFPAGIASLTVSLRGHTLTNSGTGPVTVSVFDVTGSLLRKESLLSNHAMNLGKYGSSLRLCKVQSINGRHQLLKSVCP